MEIRTPKQLQDIINKKLTNAINELSAEIETLLKMNIIKYTYNYGGDNKWYEPTYEFLESFSKSKAKIISNKIVGDVYHNPNSMSAPIYTDNNDQVKYQHGNAAGNTIIDRRKELAELLNIDGINKGFDFKGKLRKPFFDITIKYLEKNWRGMAKKALIKQGFNIK